MIIIFFFPMVSIVVKWQQIKLMMNKTRYHLIVGKGKQVMKGVGCHLCCVLLQLNKFKSPTSPFNLWFSWIKVCAPFTTHYNMANNGSCNKFALIFYHFDFEIVYMVVAIKEKQVTTLQALFGTTHYVLLQNSLQGFMVRPCVFSFL